MARLRDPQVLPGVGRDNHQGKIHGSFHEHSGLLSSGLSGGISEASPWGGEGVFYIEGASGVLGSLEPD